MKKKVECATISPEIELQKQIVAAVRARPQYEFFHLVYLCWREAKKFKFEDMTESELREVLHQIEDKQFPGTQSGCESFMCNCYRMHHTKSCPVQQFRQAIEQ